MNPQEQSAVEEAAQDMVQKLLGESASWRGLQREGQGSRDHPAGCTHTPLKRMDSLFHWFHDPTGDKSNGTVSA